MTHEQNHELISAFDRREIALSAHALYVALSLTVFRSYWFGHSFFLTFLVFASAAWFFFFFWPCTVTLDTAMSPALRSKNYCLSRADVFVTVCSHPLHPTASADTAQTRFWCTDFSVRQFWTEADLYILSWAPPPPPSPTPLRFPTLWSRSSLCPTVLSCVVRCWAKRWFHITERLIVSDFPKQKIESD